MKQKCSHFFSTGKQQSIGENQYIPRNCNIKQPTTTFLQSMFYQNLYLPLKRTKVHSA